LSKIRLVSQVANAECAVACLSMIADFYGLDATFSELRRLIDPRTTGVQVGTIRKAAGEIGLACRVDKIPIKQIENHLPLILHLHTLHFVVATECKDGRIEILDPAVGRKWLSFDQLECIYSGVAMSFRPSGQIRASFEGEKLDLRKILFDATNKYRQLIWVTFFTVFTQSSLATLPFLMQKAVDSAANTKSVDGILELTLLAIVMAIFSGVIFGVRQLVLARLGAEIMSGLLRNMFTRLMALPVRFIEERPLGEILSRYSSCRAIQNFLVAQAGSLIVDVITVLVMLGCMLAYGVDLVAVVVAGLLFQGLIYFGFLRVLKKLRERQLQSTAAHDTIFTETVRAFRAFRLFNEEANRTEKWSKLADQMLNDEKKFVRTLGIVQGFELTMESVTSAMVVLFACIAVMDGRLTLGMVLAFVMYHQYFVRAAKSGIDALMGWELLKVHIDRLNDIIGTPAEKDGDCSVKISKGTIEMKKVTFSYDKYSKKKLITNTNLRIDAGEFVALTGNSGCGKTTLLKLILGIEKPSSGCITIDGFDVSELTNKSKAKSIAVVMQDDCLLSGTIAENIAFFDPVLSKEKVEQAAIQACVHEEILAMPMGYLTYVGDLGNSLSGGQKSRIMIARALYREPRIILLDEGTAHLDIAVEKRINANFKSMNITRFAIAHRPDTLQVADRVFVLESGRLRPWHKELV
jgi:ATP-binding cassette, subfamily B, bacterial CvaB/MchF/RaxB